MICDLKPGNVLVLRDPTNPNKKNFKLTDFGGIVFLDSESLE